MSRSPFLCIAKALMAAVLLMPLLMLGGCAARTFPLHYSTHSDAYLIGFQDGRYSGMRKAGNSSAMLIKDGSRFQQDEEYRQGWLEGEQEGMRIQRESGQIASRGQRQADVRVERSPAKPDDEVLKRDSIEPLEASSLKF